jgi:hypothetical protein
LAIQKYIRVNNFVFDRQYFHSVGLAWFDEKDSQGNNTGKSMIVCQLYLIEPSKGVRLVNLKEESEDETEQVEKTLDVYAGLLRKLFESGDVEMWKNFAREDMGLAS